MARTALALELEPFPLTPLSRDEFSFSFFREERPSFYWINAGLPDSFFPGINLVTNPNGSIVYFAAIRSIEYGVQAQGWINDQLQLKTTFPFEANALNEANGDTENAAKFGDVEIAATYLLAGKRDGGNFFALDGWYRLPTGTSPFRSIFPLLASGKGAPEKAIGFILGQELGGFSFFQSIHYEKTQLITLDSSSPLWGPGLFQWPDNFHAMGRIDYLVFRRGKRLVNLFGEIRLRMSGLMEWNGRPVQYGQGQTTDRLFFLTGGVSVRVDKEFTAEGKIIHFPFEPLLIAKPRPDFGNLFSLSLEFRPF